MTDKILETVKKHNMISKGDTVGVGVSGGADSVALLHFFVTNKEKLGISELLAVHINHGIRGAEAERDMLFTKALCEKLNVPCRVYSADVPAEAEKSGESIETCARRIRYELFSEIGTSKFATAHNLNDRMETFFWNLARGTGAAGLTSIPYVRGSYIRPLLDCTRAEIEAYLAENGLSFVTDSTNNSDDYTRNKIRHNILPLMYELNPSFDRAFLRCENSLETENDYLNEKALELLNESRSGIDFTAEKLKNAPAALRLRAILLMLKERCVKDVTREQIRQTEHILLNGGSVSLNAETVNCERGVISFGKNPDIPLFSTEIKNFTDLVNTPVGSFKILNFAKKDLQIVYKSAFNNLIDCDKIIGQLKIRSRISGEGVRLYGRGVTKTLKALFNEKKIPVSERQKIAILADDNGIVWLEGFGVSERCAATHETENAVQFIRMGDNND